MANVIVMPRLSPTMEEGVLAKWLKQEGDKIAPGDIIAEVETDKANMDFPLEDEGVILKQLAKPGDTVKLGAPVAILGDAGEDISELLAEVGGAAKPQAAAETETSDAVAKAAPPKAAVSKTAQPKAAQPKAAEFESAEFEATEFEATELKEDEAGAATPRRILASPLARRLADEASLDIKTIVGSGPGGRIVKRDIERAAAQAKSAAPARAPEAAPARSAESAPQHRPAAAVAAPAVTAAPAASAAPRAEFGAQDEQVALPMIRRIAARRLVEAKQTVPHIYLTSDAAVDKLWQFREELNQAAAKSGGDKVSFNDLVLKALARALRVVPAANSSFGPDEKSATLHHRVDISVAVALADGEGLITPVVRNADTKSVGAISREVRELAERGREKKLRPEEYTGGTFSLTNLGMYGVREFCAIVNPPESGILAVGRIEKRAVVVEKDGQDEVRAERRMTLTLSCDHRILDGALGARLLSEVVVGLEQPLLLVL